MASPRQSLKAHLPSTKVVFGAPATLHKLLEADSSGRSMWDTAAPQGHLVADTTGTKLQTSSYTLCSTSVLAIPDTRNDSLSKNSCEQCSVLLKRDSTVVHFGQRCRLLQRRTLTSKYRASFMEQPFKVVFTAHPICRSKQKALEN